MKTAGKKTATKKNCDNNTCLECALCKAINYEEKRTSAPPAKGNVKALYGAEATSYYFYFSPLIKRLQTTVACKELV